MVTRSQPTPVLKASEKAPKSLKGGRFEARIEPELEAAIGEILDTFCGVGNPSDIGRLLLKMGIRCFWLNRGGEVPPACSAVMARVAEQFGEH